MMQADRSSRSVYVGNIPYDATEDKLRSIFSAVGPVLSFKILYDHETGKPKGYGFCEYKDQETATSAVRNLNGHDMCGRILRVDSASKDRARVVTDQHQSSVDDTMMQHMNEVPLLLDPQTIINNVLCSMAPEYLLEIIQQLQASLNINPNETRRFLTENPQLSFAALQILVMLGAIDAETASNSLHKQLTPTIIQPILLDQFEITRHATDL